MKTLECRTLTAGYYVTWHGHDQILAQSHCVCFTQVVASQLDIVSNSYRVRVRQMCTSLRQILTSEYEEEWVDGRTETTMH